MHVDFELKEILYFIKKKDFSFLDSNKEINIIKTTNDKAYLENILSKFSYQFLFDKFHLFINKNILNFKQDYDENIIFILDLLLEKRVYSFLSYLYNSHKYEFHFSKFKENSFYLESFLRLSILEKNDDMFFYFYGTKKHSIEQQDLIFQAILNNRQKVYKTIIEGQNFYTLQYFISNILLQHNIDVFFIKDYFQRLKDHDIKLTNANLYNYLIRNIENTECFIFLFDSLEEVNNFRICNLMEKAIRVHNYDIIYFLNNKITFKIINYDYDFITTFLESFRTDLNIRVFFENMEKFSIEKENKINIFKCLISNPNVFDFEKDINNLIYLALQKFDLDIINCLINDFNFKYENNNEIDKIKLHESFFYGINSGNSFVSYDNILFIINFFNINLYYRKNIYIYKFINNFCLKSKVVNNFIQKKNTSNEEYKKIINYFLNNEDISMNFNIKGIENKDSSEIFNFIRHKIKFKNF